MQWGSFWRTSEIWTKNWTIFPRWKRCFASLEKVASGEISELCTIASEDPTSLMYKGLGYNNVEDFYKLKEHVVGLEVTEHD